MKCFRFNRVGARIKSEADLEEIMDNLQEQALEDKKMRSYAVIPPILFDAKERKVTYRNNNGHIVNMSDEYKSRQFLNVWTPSEKELFKEKYLQHPKNFGVIASYLDRKSVADCVQYYYLSKKTENYKQLLRKSRQRTRSSRNNTQKVNSSANTSVVDILTTGVTTRLQREQQKTTVQQGRENVDISTVSTLACSTSTVTTSCSAPLVSISSSTLTNSSNTANSNQNGSPNGSPILVSSTTSSCITANTSSSPTLTTNTSLSSVTVTTSASSINSSTAVNVPVAKSPKSTDSTPPVGGDSVKSFSDFNLYDDAHPNSKVFGDGDAKSGQETVDGNSTTNNGEPHSHGVISIKKEIELAEENNVRYVCCLFCIY